MKQASFFVKSALIVLISLTAIGCGGQSFSETAERDVTTIGSGGSPSEIVEKFYQATQDKDCQAVAALVNDADPQLVEKYVEDCIQVADKFVGYRILEQSIDEIGLFARVETEVTFMEGGQEKTNTGTRFLVRIDNEWKLTEIR
ncbi:MAG: hypothetical protein ACYC6O_01985 [Thermoleophilia bacterium]